MRIVAYVDGFSVYYACYRGPTKAAYAHLKWLDYRTLCEAMFADDDVVLVRLFTAIAPNPPADPGQAMRHDTYLRPPAGVAPAQTVFVYQEKQSDVSLASHLLVDASDGRFDRAVLFTNDTDFLEPIKLVRARFGLEVIVVSPDVTISKELKKAASAGWVLDRGLLFTCQLPDQLIDSAGRIIHKPVQWHHGTEPNDSSGGKGR